MRKCLIVILVIVVAVILFHPGRHAKYYNFIPVLNTINELVPVKNQNEPHHNLKECPFVFYSKLILSGVELDTSEIYNVTNFRATLIGGEYLPRDCQPIFKTALIVPYRNRKRHLQVFLNYMHTFLQMQKIHYVVIIVEQNDDLPFNRAKMINVGAKEAIKANFPCLVLHDVDLFPLNMGNIYACTKKPRHMSSSIDTMRFNLPYLELSGGAVAILADDFKRINGMSNVFDGWGGEDDNFFKRLKSYNMVPYRFAPEISRYAMLFHKREQPSKDRWNKIEQGTTKQNRDGLNTIPEYTVERKPLYTHLLV